MLRPMCVEAFGAAWNGLAPALLDFVVDERRQGPGRGLRSSEFLGCFAGDKTIGFVNCSFTVVVFGKVLAIREGKMHDGTAV